MNGLTTTTIARPLAVTTVVLAALVTAPGAAQAAQGRPEQRFVIVATDLSGTGRLVATGPISGVGTDTLLEHTLNADGTFTDRDRFDLPGGQVVLSDSYTAQFSSDPRSCVTSIQIDGTYTIVDATGDFAGATGGGSFRAAGTFVAGRDATGACRALDSTPRAFTERVHGSGVTTLP